MTALGLCWFLTSAQVLCDFPAPNLTLCVPPWILASLNEVKFNANFIFDADVCLEPNQ